MKCICGSKLGFPKNYSKNFKSAECLNCNSVKFLSNENIVFDYNSDNQKYSDENYLAEGEFRWAHKKLIKILKSDSGKTLEMGSYTGFFINELKSKYGSNVYGIDLNKKAINYGLKIYPDLAGRLDFDDAFKNIEFNNILLIDVFEHVLNPKEFVDNISERLSKGGRIYLSGPTIERIFFDRSDKPPHHTWRYSSKGLTLFFNKMGYKLINEYVERNGPLAVRNFIGLIMTKFNKEYYGESVVSSVNKKSIFLNLLTTLLGSLVSVFLFLLNKQYCSRMMVYEKI